MTDLSRVQDIIAGDMEDIVAMFRPGAKIAVLVRSPGYPERDLLMTDDSFDELIAMIERRKTAEAAKPPRETADSIDAADAMARAHYEHDLLP